MPLDIREASEKLGIERRHLGRTIAPLMAETGDAWQQAPEAPWHFRSDTMWQWELYIATRRNLIAAKVWSMKRPYSIADLEDIAVADMYEDYQPDGINAVKQILNKSVDRQIGIIRDET